MGVKLNVDLFSIIQQEHWDLLPDELFTLLLYYEILIHYELCELSEFYAFRILVKKHLNAMPVSIDSNSSLDEQSIMSIEGLDVASTFFKNVKNAPERKIVVHVELHNKSTVSLFLDLLKEILSSDVIAVKNITIKLKELSLVNEEAILDDLHNSSLKVPLNFIVMGDDYSFADNLYTTLLEYKIWGDYFFDMNEYAIYAKNDGGGGKIDMKAVLAQKPVNLEIFHFPLAIQQENISNHTFLFISSCIEKMIFLKYKVWPVKSVNDGL